MKLSVIFTTIFIVSIAYGQTDGGVDPWDSGVYREDDCYGRGVEFPEVDPEGLVELAGGIVEAGKWGMLDDRTKRMKLRRNKSPVHWRLISMKPGSTLFFCGDYQAEALEATKQWAKTIGRAGTGGINFVQRCVNPNTLKEGDRIITVLSKGTSKYADKKCARAKEHHKVAVGAVAPPAGGPNTFIVFCMKPGGGGFWGGGIDVMGTLVHEIGHQWGMCDQYTVRGIKDNCDPNHKSRRKDASAAMSNTLRDDIISDDKTGIKHAACIDYTHLKGKSKNTKVEDVNGTWIKHLKGKFTCSKRYKY